MLWMFIFHLEYFLNYKNFCKDDKKNIQKLNGAPFSEYIVEPKTELRFIYSFLRLKLFTQLFF